MPSIETIKDISKKNHLNLPLSLLNLYDKSDLCELSSEDINDFMFILNRIKCGRAAKYPEFLDGYNTLCFKQTVNRVPVRIFLYEKRTDGERIIIVKFDVDKGKHNVDDHKSRCLKKHANIIELESPRSAEARQKQTETPTLTTNDEKKYNFLWSESPIWSEALEVLQQTWIMLNQKNTVKNKSQLNEYVTQAINNLFELLKYVGPNMPVSSFLFTEEQLILNYHDNSSVSLPYLFIDDDTQVFLSWFYINFTKHCETEQQTILSEIIYQQLKPHLHQKYHKKETKPSQSILPSTFVLNQYKKTCEALILNNTETVQGYGISMGTLPFWLSVSSTCLLSQINKQKFPQEPTDAKTALTLISKLSLNHKEIILHFLKNSYQHLEYTAVIDAIPFALERYSALSIVNYNLKNWKQLFTKDHPWLKRHTSVLRPPIYLKKISEGSLDSVSAGRLDSASSQSTASKTSHFSNSTRKNNKKKNKKKKRENKTKTGAAKKVSLTDIINNFRGTDEDWLDTAFLDTKKQTNTDRLKSLNINLKSIPTELVYLICIACYRYNLDPMLIPLETLKEYYPKCSVNREAIRDLSRSSELIVNEKSYDTNPIKLRALSLLSCDELVHLDLHQPPSDQEAVELITLIQEDASLYRADIHDAKLFWQKSLMHNNITSPTSTQPELIIVRRLITMYHSDEISETIKKRVLNHIKIALCYALKYHYIGVYNSKKLNLISLLPSEMKTLLLNSIAYMKKISEEIINMISGCVDFSGDKAHIHDRRPGRDVTMFTFLLKFLDEERYDSSDETNLKKATSMFNKLISMGAEPGTCNSSYYFGNYTCMKNELFECLLLYSYDLFQYFCELGVPVERNLMVLKNHTSDAFIRHFVTGQDTHSTCTLLPIIRFNITFSQVKILECFIQSDLSVWQNNTELCNQLIHALKTRQTFESLLSSINSNDHRHAQAKEYFIKLTHCRTMLSAVESKIYPTVIDYISNPMLEDGNTDTTPYQPHIKFLSKLNQSGTDTDTANTIKMLQMLYFTNNYILEQKERTQTLSIDETLSTTLKYYENTITNFLRYTQVDFSNFYVSSIRGNSLPLISFSIRFNQVELFTVLYEKGADLSLRSTHGLLPIDFVTDETDPRISLALINQQTSKSTLLNYKKRHKEISAFLIAANEVNESSTSPERHLTDLLGVQTLIMAPHNELMDRFEKLISLDAVNHNMFMLLIKWWVSSVFNMKMNGDKIPIKVINRIRNIRKKYLSHPSPSNTPPHLLSKQLMFSLWRCQSNVTRNHSTEQHHMQKHLKETQLHSR